MSSTVLEKNQKNQKKQKKQQKQQKSKRRYTILQREYVVEQHPYHLSRLSYWPARNTYYLLLAISILFLLHPWLRRFAWAWPLMLLFYERESKFLRQGAADLFFKLLIYAIVIGILGILQTLFLQWIRLARDEVTREVLMRLSLTINRLPVIVTILEIFTLGLRGVWALDYRLLRRRKRRALSGVILRLI